MLQSEELPGFERLPNFEKKDLLSLRIRCINYIPPKKSPKNGIPFEKILLELIPFTNKNDEYDVIRRRITGFLFDRRDFLVINISNLTKFLRLKEKTTTISYLRAAGYIQDKLLCKYKKEDPFVESILPKISKSKDRSELRNWDFYSLRIEYRLLREFCQNFHIFFKTKIVDFIGLLRFFLRNCNDRQQFIIQLLEHINEGNEEIQQIIEILQRGGYILDNLMNKFLNAISIVFQAKMLECAKGSPTFFSQMKFQNGTKLNHNFSTPWKKLVKIAKSCYDNIWKSNLQALKPIPNPNNISKRKLPIPQISGYFSHQETVFSSPYPIPEKQTDNEPLSLKTFNWDAEATLLLTDEIDDTLMHQFPNNNDSSLMLTNNDDDTLMLTNNDDTLMLTDNEDTLLFQIFDQL